MVFVEALAWGCPQHSQQEKQQLLNSIQTKELWFEERRLGFFTRFGCDAHKSPFCWEFLRCTEIQEGAGVGCMEVEALWFTS